MTLETRTPSKPEPRPVTPVFALCEQHALMDEVAPLLDKASVPVQLFLTLENLVTALEETPSAVILLNAGILPADLTISDAVAQFHARSGSDATFLCIVGETDIEQHLAAMRAGAVRCFVEPCLPDEIATYLIELCGANEPQPDKVLVLGDKATDAAHLLEEAGYRTHTLANPLEIIAALQRFQPDLVVMEDSLSPASSCELTAIVREHEDFPLTPIVILSSDMDEQGHMEALRAGADDFVVESAAKEQLAAVVESRVRRTRAMRARLGTGSMDDRVTGLYNRRHLFHELEKALADPTFQAPGNGLIYCEVHALLPPAERHDWENRDVFLAQVGQFIRCHLVPSDIAARVGSTSYALLVRRSDPDGLLTLTERLRLFFAGQIIEHEDKQARLSVSFGVVPATSPTGNAASMIARGQTTCAMTKEGGKRPAIGTESAASPADQTRETIIAKIVSDALAHDGFSVVFQPIAATGEQLQEHYDTLLRLKARSGKLIMPDAFLPVAEKSGLMPAIDRWVLRKALELLSERTERTVPTRLIVRQSMASIHFEKWTMWLQKQLQTYALGESTPILEFQLGDVLANLEVANARFGILSQSGMDICVSHYNDQPAAKTILDELPITLIRPDVSLFGEQEDSLKLNRLIQHAHDKGIRVIAGRIEGYGEVQRAWQSRADFIVGFFVQPPLETLEFDFSEAGGES